MALLLALWQLALPSNAAESVSFSEAWQALLKNNDGLAAERANIDKNKHLQDAAGDLYLPKVDLRGRYTYFDDDIELKPSQILDRMNNAPDLGELFPNVAGELNEALTTQIAKQSQFKSSVTAIWPVFTGFKIEAAQDIAHYRTEEARHLLEMEQHAKFEDLAKIYFGTVLAKEVLRTRVQVEEGLQKHRDIALKYEAQGQIAKVERLQAEASLDRATVERKKAERQVEIAQIALTQMIKSQDNTIPSSALFTNETIPPKSDFLRNTLATYPGLNLLSAKREQAKGLVKVEQGNYYPDVYLFGEYNVYEDDSIVSDLRPDWIVGVGVSVPLLDPGGRSGKLNAAHSTVTQVDYLRAQATRDLTTLVEKTYRESQQALEEYAGLKSSIELAEENLHLRSKAFSQGLATSIDVIDAELFLASIKTQRLVASYHYVISLSQLMAISGGINNFESYQNKSAPEVQ
ncbi:TolC family protein [Corallincola spongiicola]|uniref:TolC family protein n=1 Tax=Corallincola spongiicola TaxID=2520508 RepID=A0ABY1WVX7_9GAMM|nr:TolC family protein [Corallincola spongiicola]